MEDDTPPLERFRRGLTVIRDIAYNDAVQSKSPLWRAYTDLMWLARALGVVINVQSPDIHTYPFHLYLTSEDNDC